MCTTGIFVNNRPEYLQLEYYYDWPYNHTTLIYKFKVFLKILKHATI